MKTGKLILVPTPIDDETLLPISDVEILKKAYSNGDLILVEELKEGRRRWLRYGLPREAIEHFILYNEHTRDDLLSQVITDLKKGKDAYLMSDCGLPAFCDPGQELVDACHHNGIKVTSLSFANSIALAVALSGYPHNRFIFEGFVPVRQDERKRELIRIFKQKETSILMDTPYRLKKLLEEIIDNSWTRELCLAVDLNQPSEIIMRGTAKKLKSQLTDFKREFIMILSPL